MPSSPRARSTRPRIPAHPSPTRLRVGAGSRARVVAVVGASLVVSAILAGCVSVSGRGVVPSGSPTGPRPTADAAAPGGTDVSDVVPSPDPAPTVSASVGGEARVDDGVVVSVTGVAATTVTASTPGEVSGPAVVVSVEVANRGPDPASVDSAVVDLIASDGAWGVGTTAGGGRPLAGTLSPGAVRSGSYVFMLSDPRGRSVSVTVSHAAGAPVARFEGSVS